MAEQRDDGKPGSEVEPAGSSTPASPPAQPPMDPAQLEQFRQFQQFQDYLRFTQSQQGNQPAPPPDAGVVQAPPSQPAPQQGGAQPPMIPPGYQLVPAERRRAPKWVSWLGKKVLAWVLALVILAVAGTWLYNHFFPNDSGKTSAQLAQEGGGKYHTNHLFSTNPYEAVRFVYHNIAQGRIADACGRFQNEGTRDIQTQFAQDIAQTFRQNAAQTDCKKAVEFLTTQVTNKNDYAESLPSSVSAPLPGDTVTIDSCTFSVQGGPALGVFTVSQVDKGQWLITGHAIGPAKCSGVPTTSPTG
ncbi:hypothetical protein H4696_006117 [Amycolatopsis lexingtonensis]|uniref:Mce-associated membrane protein n=1 Tax=Amycolatopsis lexingtonensis TaxID=218822 RepID=A0ABR9I749_9PSEU|nr:hypothetical protein [Amycolatopsis lexingtonensis]MBE1499017.1 hypothetical protein [Amycolatopsis lexingtonensis]